MQTPIVVGDLLYACRDNGVLTCFDARTGKQHYRQRLDGNGFTASPVAAGDKIYFTSEDGRVHVIKAGPAFAVLGENELGEPCLATPALSNGTI
jgi:outer membrane protein assembly factor BamB